LKQNGCGNACDCREDVAGVTRQPLRHHRAVGVTGCVDALLVNVALGQDVGSDGLGETNVVDRRGKGRIAAATCVPRFAPREA
jgi:hypothetical protein